MKNIETKNIQVNGAQEINVNTIMKGNAVMRGNPGRQVISQAHYFKGNVNRVNVKGYLGGASIDREKEVGEHIVDIGQCDVGKNLR